MSSIPPAPEPQGSEPSYQPPAQGSSASQANNYSPNAYPAAPAEHSAPTHNESKTLGIVAFVVSLAAVVIGAIVVYIGGQALGSVVEYTGASGTSVDPESVPAAGQEAAATGALLTFVGFAVFGVLALWGFIQGIVAIVKNRGRGWGIAALILAVVGGVVVAVLWFAGLTAGAAPFITS